MMASCARRLCVRLRIVLTVALAAAVWLSTAQPALAQSKVVEEDWELVVLIPDGANVAPQVTCILAPFGSLAAMHGVLELNHHGGSHFAPGGVQLELFDGEHALGNHVELVAGDVLSQSGETVTWTQQMVLEPGKLTFRILNGQSNSWGNFSGQLVHQSPYLPTGFVNYNPLVAVAHSGVSYAANRVHSLVLKSVRVYDNGQLVAEDTSPKIVFQHEH